MNIKGRPESLDQKWFWRALCCPDCRSRLETDGALTCSRCGFTDESGRDLRSQALHERTLVFSTKPRSDPSTVLSSLNTTRPTITYSGPTAVRDSRQLMSEISNRLPGRGAVLDLGCGPRDQAICFEHLGFSYVGVDYLGDGADLLADAHSLPFADSFFDCVFSYAVLEHLHNPYLAVKEIARVLTPGGWYIGTVSQGEPFHSSYFHHTAWGLLSLVGSVPELELVRMWDGTETLASLASMGRYPRVIRSLLSGVCAVHDWLPWLAPRRMRWSVKDKEIDALYRAGAICFVIRKANP